MIGERLCFLRLKVGEKIKRIITQIIKMKFETHEMQLTSFA